MTRSRRIKVVATLGPASKSYETIRALKVEGADVERIFIDTPDMDWEEKIDVEDGPLDDFDIDVSFKDVK